MPQMNAAYWFAFSGLLYYLFVQLSYVPSSDTFSQWAGPSSIKNIFLQICPQSSPKEGTLQLKFPLAPLMSTTKASHLTLTIALYSLQPIVLVLSQLLVTVDTPQLLATLLKSPVLWSHFFYVSYVSSFCIAFYNAAVIPWSSATHPTSIESHLQNAFWHIKQNPCVIGTSAYLEIHGHCIS